jgi:hypothetical protein
VAIVYAGLGENDQALDWIEKAYKDRSSAIVFAKVDPQLDVQSLLHRLAFQN